MNRPALGNLFYRQPRLTVLAMGFILVAGLAALQTLARQEDPTMTRRFAQVETELPGASAMRIEALVTERIEGRLREIAAIREMRSVSRAGRSIIIVELADRVGPDSADTIWSEVRDKLAEVEAELPPAASKPILEVREPIASTLLLAFSWAAGEEAQLGILSRLARDLEIRLANLPGTRETRLYGAAVEEILVEVDPQALAAANVSTERLAERIAAADTRGAAGRLQGRNSEVLVEVMAELDSTERIGAIPVQRVHSGEVLRVADLATIRKQLRDPPPSVALHSGDRAVVLAVVMEPDQRIDHWVSAARNMVDAYGAELPPQIRLEVIFDQNHYTSARLSELSLSLLTALLLIMLLLLVCMGLRAAVTVGIALPLSMAMVLSGLMFLDIPLHQMSVTGLIIALGLLIDNAIVVVEEYKLRRRQGLPIDEAIGGSVRRLFVPLAASTATTIFAFLPVAFSPGATGEFTGAIAISVVLSVASSFLLAMTVIPAMAGFFERHLPLATPAGRSPWWLHGVSHNGLRAAYAASLALILRRPLLGIAVGLALPLLGFAFASSLTLQFFPPVDRNQFQIQMTLPAEASIHETRRNVEQLRSILGQYPDIEADTFFLGESAPRVYYNTIGNQDGIAAYASGFVTTRSARATRELLPTLQQHLSDAFPNARVLALPFEQGPPFDAPIEVRIVGEDLAVLRQQGEGLRRLLAATAGVTYTHASLDRAEPTLAVFPDENRAAQAGLLLGELPSLLHSSLNGHPAGFIMEGIHELPIRVRQGGDLRRDPAQLASLPLLAATERSPGYAGVPLELLAELRLQPGVSSIERFQGERINTVQGFLSPYALPAAALADFERRLAASDWSLPAGYRLQTGGEAEQRNESVGRLLRTFLLFLLLMIAVVVLSLNSFRHATIIGMVGLLSVGLALFGVRLFGWPLGFTAMIGTLGLVGLAINGAIIVLSALKADPQAAAGDIESCRSVVLDSTRHIVSTTLTTIAGFMPLILFGGTFWPPLATAIAGGVAGSAILALYFVPAVFVLLGPKTPQAVIDVREDGAMPMPLLAVGRR